MQTSRIKQEHNFFYLFNLSLHLETIPVLWKTSCVVPVPKKTTPSGLNDYRPVALTSHVMKVLERLVLAHLRPQVRSFLDPLQFAYQPHLGVDDAIIYLLQRAHSYLNGSGCTVRITFFDFSSAFNTIQPRLLSDKLQAMRVNSSTISWITNYLTDRPQYVRLGSVLSDVVVGSIGAPQGTVLSPFLFTLYTSDFQYNSESCHLQKFSDDSAVVGCIRDGREEEYRALVGDFVEWTGRNHLLLNVAKTREMVIDFRRKRTSPPLPLCILGEDVAIVEDYKYLGVHLRAVSTAALKNLETLLPIHFEWGDVTFFRFRRNAFWAGERRFSGFSRSKVEQCSTFEAEEEASANQIPCKQI